MGAWRMKCCTSRKLMLTGKLLKKFPSDGVSDCRLEENLVEKSLKSDPGLIMLDC